VQEQLRTVLDHITEALTNRRSPILASLRPPASTGQLADLESRLGTPLLPEIRDLYLWHDGTTGIVDAFQLNDDFVFISTAQATTEHETMTQIARDLFPDPHAAERLWRPTWLPIGSSYAGSLLIADHTPGDTFGSIFPYEHGNGARHDRGWPDLTTLLNELLESATTD
jgi:cell wall assembly regulator SMI1